MTRKQLTNNEIFNAKPRDRAYRLYAGGGLYVEVMPTGSKLWRFKYRFGGKEKRLALGKYGKKLGEVTLKKAKEARDQAKNLLQPVMDGKVEIRPAIDPAEHRKEQKQATRIVAAVNSQTFEAVALDWHTKRSPRWTEKTADRILRRLERDIFPAIGQKPVTDLTTDEVMKPLQVIAERGARDTAHRVRREVIKIIRHADVHKLADELTRKKEDLPDAASRHFSAITDPQKVGELLRALDRYQGGSETFCAIRFAPLVFARPGELRHVEWSEIDLDAAEWRIPAEKMKRGIAHLVPLSRQAIAILREIQPLTGGGKYVFPSIRSADRPMSDNTLNAALRRLGYTKEEMTTHGWRSTASTLLNEGINGKSFRADAIERQLSHMDSDQTRAAYHRAEHLAERRLMMQVWADYLDTLRQSDNVVSFREVG